MDRVFLILAILILLPSCASSKRDPVDQPSLSVYQKKVLEEDRRTMEVLSKAAVLSAKSLAVFVRTEQAVHQPAMTAEQVRQARFQDSYIPVNMEQKVEYAWDSSPEPLLSSLAANAGYRLVYTNERPPIAKSVTVSSKPRMISDYINIIEQQTTGYIKEIRVDDKSDDKVIRVFYSKF